MKLVKKMLGFYRLKHTDARYAELRNSTYYCSVYTDLTFNLPKSWRIQLDGSFQTPTVYGLYKMAAQGTSDISVRKNLCNDKLTLTLTFRDIFRTNTRNAYFTNPQDNVLKSVMYQTYYTQQLQLGIMYRFGKARYTRQRNVANLEELSRIGSSGM